MPKKNRQKCNGRYNIYKDPKQKNLLKIKNLGLFSRRIVKKVTEGKI